MEVGKDTKFTLSIETAVSIGVTIFMVVGLWFNLQADIQEAKELPEPPVSRTEYDLKDQMIRNSIMNTEDKVEKLNVEVWLKIKHFDKIGYISERFIGSQNNIEDSFRNNHQNYETNKKIDQRNY